MPDSDGVSVVITTFYRNELLRRAIESVLDQTMQPMEVFVVDGSGTEHARSVVAHYDDVVSYIPQEENRGPVADRNRGIAHTTGRYVHLLDDDDALAPAALEKKVARLRETGAGVVYSGLRRERDEEMVLLPGDEGRGDVLELALTMQQPPIFPSTMLIERSILTQCVPLPERYSGAGDTALVIELARRTDFDFVAKPLTNRGEAGTSLAYSWEAVRARRLLLREYADVYADFPDRVKRTALAGSYALEGQVRLKERLWSAKAIGAFGLAVYYGGPRPDRVGALVASVFGRWVWQRSRTLFTRLRR